MSNRKHCSSGLQDLFKPPVPPARCNYIDSRDRLRLERQIRTKDQEKKIEAKISQYPKIKDQPPVEDLVKFINGDDTSEREKRKDMKQDKKNIQSLKLEKQQMEDQKRIDIDDRIAEVNKRLKHGQHYDYQHKCGKASQNDNNENQVILQGHQPTMIKVKRQVVQLIHHKQPTSHKKQSKANGQNLPYSGQNSPKACQKFQNAQKIIPNESTAGQNVRKSAQKTGETISNGPKSVTTQSTPTTPLQKCRTDDKPAQQLQNAVQANSMGGKKGHDQEAVSDVCNKNGTVDSMEASKHKTGKHNRSVQRGRMENPARATHNADATSQLAGRKSPLRSNDQENHKKKLMHKKSEDIDTIFLPRDEVDDADEYDPEVEAFKRFCLDSSPVPKKEKVQVNANLKDILIKTMKCA